MRRTNITLLIIYLFFTLYFAIFNWSMFIVMLNVSLGFAILNIPVIIVLFLLGLIFMLIQWGLATIGKMKMEKDFAEKNSEILQLKAAQYDTQLTEVRRNSVSLKELHQKLNEVMMKFGIKEEDKTSDLKKAEANEIERY